jgi:hypothetical protein
VLAQAVGGVVVVVKPWARQKGGGHYPNAGSSVGSSVQTGSPTGGSRAISVFPTCLKLAQLVKSKWSPYPTPKILNFCMTRALNILNNFLNCANFIFPTKIKLQILEQIQYLNI